MTKNLLKVSFILYLTLYVNGLFSQNNNWKEYYSDNLIKIEYKYQVCEFSSTASQELIVLRFNNLTNNKIFLSYDLLLWQNDTEINTELNSSEYLKEIRLDPNEIKTSSCINDNLKEFTIFSGFIHNKTFERFVTLTKFELININSKND